MGPDDIFDIFSYSDELHHAPICEHWALYNTLLSRLFVEQPFMITLDPKTESYMTVALQTRNIYPPKPVLFCLIMPAPSFDDSVALKEAGETMRKLLIGADAPEIRVVHGMCVSGNRVAFYCYDREQEVFVPELGQLCFDLNFMEGDGATRMIEVAEDVKNMCRGVIGKLKF
jgi:hypothetical protein